MSVRLIELQYRRGVPLEIVRAQGSPGTGAAAGGTASEQPVEAVRIEGDPAIDLPGSKGAERAETNPLTRKAIERLTEQINAVIDIINTRVTFEIHEETGDVIIKVVDNETGEVVREIPPEELIGIVRKLAQLMGLLVDEKS